MVKLRKTAMWIGGVIVLVLLLLWATGALGPVYPGLGGPRGRPLGLPQNPA
jgi:hypothetical protein